MLHGYQQPVRAVPSCSVSIAEILQIVALMILVGKVENYQSDGYAECRMEKSFVL